MLLLLGTVAGVMGVIQAFRFGFLAAVNDTFNASYTFNASVGAVALILSIPSDSGDPRRLLDAQRSGCSGVSVRPAQLIILAALVRSPKLRIFRLPSCLVLLYRCKMAIVSALDYSSLSK